MTDDDEIDRRLDGLEARMDAMGKRFDRLVSFLIGDEPDFAEDRFDEAAPIWTQLDELDDEIAELQQDVASIAADVRTRTDGGDLSKVERAERHARNELVRRAADLSNNGTELAVLQASTALEQSKPSQNWHYQTVKDAFENLRSKWEAVYIKNEPKRLILLERGLSRELLLTVEEDLGRDDLTKELISGTERGEGSA